MKTKEKFHDNYFSNWVKCKLRSWQENISVMDSKIIHLNWQWPQGHLYIQTWRRKKLSSNASSRPNKKPIVFYEIEHKHKGGCQNEKAIKVVNSNFICVSMFQS